MPRRTTRIRTTRKGVEPLGFRWRFRGIGWKKEIGCGRFETVALGLLESFFLVFRQARKRALNSELANGRLAMMAIVGLWVQESIETKEGGWVQGCLQSEGEGVNGSGSYTCENHETICAMNIICLQERLQPILHDLHGDGQKLPGT